MTSSPPLLAEDLTEMSLLGGFMFLLNEMRDLYKGNRKPKDLPKDDEEAQIASFAFMKELFAPIAEGDVFPLSPVTIQAVVVAAKDILEPLQGEKRYQAHLDMLDCLVNNEQHYKAGDKSYNGPIFLNYSDDKEAVGHEVVYSIVLDHSKKRLTVVFRGSVTEQDWTANLSVTQIKVENPIQNGTPPDLVMHKGFYEYIFEHVKNNKGVDDKEDVDDDNPKQQMTSFDVIMQEVLNLLKEFPDYAVYTTGVSLGGALTIVFCFFAAAHPELQQRKGYPVKCYSFASPKVGAISFRRACQELEENGHLLLCRVANDNDPVVPLPRQLCAVYPCCGLEYIMMTCLCFLQAKIYRHVGLGLMLPQRKSDYARFVHAKIQSNWARTLFSDWGKLFGRMILIPCHCYIVCLTCTNPALYRDAHGYPEYWRRVQDQVEYLRRLDGGRVTLEKLYEQFMEGDRSLVRTRFM